MRWTVQWQTASGAAEHKTYEHTKTAGPQIMALVDMQGWGGGMEYDAAYHIVH